MRGSRNGKPKWISAVLCLLLLCSFIPFGGCEHEAAAKQPEILSGLGSGRFDVRTGDPGTAAVGSIQLYAKGGNELGIRIMADVTIDPEDLGGVAFSLPAGCRLDQVTCTYPEEGDGLDDPPVNIWSTASENEKYTVMIEIGRNRSGNTPSGGGTGTVFIEASRPLPGTPDPLLFGVECGADTKDGNVIMGLAWSEIPVSLSRIGK